MDQVFEKIKKSLLNTDPVYWAENNLMLDGKPYKLGNGYKPMRDILRYLCVKGLEKNSKPVTIVKGRQIGITVLAAVADLFFMASGNFGEGTSNPPIAVAHLFPILELSNSFSKVKLNAMINGASFSDTDDKKGKRKENVIQKLIDKSSESNNSLNFKQFTGGNHLFIDSCGIDGNRMMGKSGSVVLYDEFQKIPPLATGNINKILTKSSYGPIGEGVQFYFGTPLQRGSMFYDMWHHSSQQYYHLGCEKCQQFFPLYTPGSNDWETIWIYGQVIRCPHCAFEQNKIDAIERGKWIPAKSTADSKYIGFHLNQLYIPDFTKEKILSEKPENNSINTERIWNTEILGEFWSGDAGVISSEQIREFCGDPERKFSAGISPDDNKLVFLGIDIGAKNDLEQLADGKKSVAQGQSYSTAVVLSVSGAQKFVIEYAVKFKRNDLASKKGLIEQLMRRYSVNLGVMDLGFTQDLSEILQTEFGDRFLSSQASFRVNNHIKFNSEIFPKVITFEKDFWITEMYDQMKKGNIRFPLGSYEQIAWLIQHCISMELSPSYSRGGEVSAHYKKAGNNDGFMALINAYLAYRYYITDGFITQHSISGKKKSKKALVVLGYVPRF